MSGRNNLARELEELFDIKKAKLRGEKIMSQEAMEAQRDIRMLTLMFRDGVPNVNIKVTDTESIIWDAQAQKLLYKKNNCTQLLEAAPNDIRVKMRPHLTLLVKAAKDFFQD